MEITPEIVKKIEETHDAVNDIKVVLKGYDGQKGLCKRVDEVEVKHDKLNVRFTILWVSLVSGGVLGGGVYEIVKALTH